MSKAAKTSWISVCSRVAATANVARRENVAVLPVRDRRDEYTGVGEITVGEDEEIPEHRSSSGFFQSRGCETGANGERSGAGCKPPALVNRGLAWRLLMVLIDSELPV
jgi:hypothetical protein